jgi:hypothetical protein
VSAAAEPARSRKATASLVAAHFETVGASANMPVRQQRQVSTKAVARAGCDCFTPEGLRGRGYRSACGLLKVGVSASVRNSSRRSFTR